MALFTNTFTRRFAFSLSQLCNVLITRKLRRRLDSTEAGRGIDANCFNPGLIVGTGLFRDQNPIFTKVKVVSTLFHNHVCMISQVTHCFVHVLVG
jgi:hypothetical protein